MSIIFDFSWRVKSFVKDSWFDFRTNLQRLYRPSHVADVDVWALILLLLRKHTPS